MHKMAKKGMIPPGYGGYPGYGGHATAYVRSLPAICYFSLLTLAFLQVQPMPHPMYPAAAPPPGSYPVQPGAVYPPPGTAYPQHPPPPGAYPPAGAYPPQAPGYPPQPGNDISHF